MSYYGARGDFYTGRTGYYRGDPGFFSSLGNIVKGVAGGLVKSYTGVDLFGSGSGGQQLGFTPSLNQSNYIQQPSLTAAGSASRRGAVGRSGRRLSGAASQFPRMGGAGPMMGGPLVTRGAGPAMGGYRRARRGRMNVTNPRALRRAIRRTHGFAKLAMKTIHLVHPKKRATFGGFRRKRRK